MIMIYWISYCLIAKDILYLKLSPFIKKSEITFKNQAQPLESITEICSVLETTQEPHSQYKCLLALNKIFKNLKDSEQIKTACGVMGISLEKMLTKGLEQEPQWAQEYMGKHLLTIAILPEHLKDLYQQHQAHHEKALHAALCQAGRGYKNYCLVPLSKGISLLQSLLTCKPVLIIVGLSGCGGITGKSVASYFTGIEKQTKTLALKLGKNIGIFLGCMIAGISLAKLCGDKCLAILKNSEETLRSQPWFIADDLPLPTQEQPTTEPQPRLEATRTEPTLIEEPPCPLYMTQRG